jgi:radical SAM superfamily enzyme
MICIKCKSKNIEAWNNKDYVCNFCKYSSTYDEVMSEEEYNKFISSREYRW